MLQWVLCSLYCIASFRWYYNIQGGSKKTHHPRNSGIRSILNRFWISKKILKANTEEHWFPKSHFIPFCIPGTACVWTFFWKIANFFRFTGKIHLPELATFIGSSWSAPQNEAEKISISADMFITVINELFPAGQRFAQCYPSLFQKNWKYPICSNSKTIVKKQYNN